MKLLDIQQDIYRTGNYADSPTTAVSNRITGYINKRHRMILGRPALSRLRDDQISFSSVASQRTYAMGPAVSRIKSIFDGTTNQLRLTERTLSWIRTVDPRLATTGTPEAWAPVSIKQVQAQPAAACDLHVISTSAADGAGVTCYVEYTTTGGYRQSTSKAMNGVTDVALTSTTNVIEVDKFYLSAAATGTVTLLDAVGGNVLATIAPGQSYGRYLVIQLWPTPSSVWTYQVDYTREIADMVQPNDEPLLPPDFHYLLSVGARMDEYEKLDDARRQLLIPEWERGIIELENYVINSPDYLIVPGGQQRVNWSNLGPFYPSGGWW